MVLPILVAAAAINTHTARLYAAIALTRLVSTVANWVVAVNESLTGHSNLLSKLLCLCLTEEIVTELAHYPGIEFLLSLTQISSTIDENRNKLLRTVLPPLISELIVAIFLNIIKVLSKCRYNMELKVLIVNGAEGCHLTSWQGLSVTWTWKAWKGSWMISLRLRQRCECAWKSRLNEPTASSWNRVCLGAWSLEYPS